jgi:hypothetical protein
VDAKKSTFILGLAFLAGLGTTAAGGDFFTDRGSIWAGGSLGYINENTRNSNPPMNMFMLSPVIRYFPVKYMVVSPAFSWITMSQTDKNDNGYTSGTYSIGPELGIAYGNNIPAVPYLISAVQYAHSYSSTSTTGTGAFSPFSQTVKSGADGYRIPLFGGIMVPIVEGLGIQLEAGFIYKHLRDYTHKRSSDMSTFSISVGVCGVGKRMGISFLNTFTDFLL